jgi:uncharacterized protein YecE (DUF72 family)
MIKVGCCGFPVAMNRYFEHFSLVELNRTFYEYPREKTLVGWRAHAPAHFEFTVKAHQDISHRARMKIGEDSLRAFEQMKGICRLLGSKVLLIQTPGSFKPDRLSDAEKFLAEVDRDDLILTWETRGPSWEADEAQERLGRALKSLNVEHVTDPLRIQPAYTCKLAYFRLHGLGKRLYYYQYDEEDLKRLAEIACRFEKKTRMVYILFNNLAMFDDAARFARYLSTGAFPRSGETPGLKPIEEIIGKTRFPASKSELIRRIGWKLAELNEHKQVRLENLLSGLPLHTYKNAEELIRNIRAFEALSD